MKTQMCSRCGERPAVVFIQKMEGDEVKPEGLCIKCAKELNIGPIKQMIDKMGISDEELEQASEQMTQFMENMDDFDFGNLSEMFGGEMGDGAQTMPFGNVFGNIERVFARSAACAVGDAHIGGIELRNLLSCTADIFKSGVGLGRKNLKRHGHFSAVKDINNFHIVCSLRGHIILFLSRC